MANFFDLFFAAIDPKKSAAVSSNSGLRQVYGPVFESVELPHTQALNTRQPTLREISSVGFVDISSGGNGRTPGATGPTFQTRDWAALIGSFFQQAVGSATGTTVDPYYKDPFGGKPGPGATVNVDPYYKDPFGGKPANPQVTGSGYNPPISPGNVSIVPGGVWYGDVFIPYGSPGGGKGGPPPPPPPPSNPYGLPTSPTTQAPTTAPTGFQPGSSLNVG